jgi:hypothetical protein
MPRCRKDRTSGNKQIPDPMYTTIAIDYPCSWIITHARCANVMRRVGVDVAVDVGLATSAVLSDLEAGRTYYFVVTADDTSGNESVFSTEVPYAIPLTDNACGFANLALCATASASSVWSAGYEAAQATDGNGGRAGIVPMGTRPGPGWRWTWALSPPLIPSCSRKPSTASRASTCSTEVGAPGATLCQAAASEPPKGIPLQP